MKKYAIISILIYVYLIGITQIWGKSSDTVIPSSAILMGKSGKESDKGIEIPYDEAVDYIQSFMGVTKADVEDKLKQYSFLNLAKISVRENLLYIPDKNRIKQFLAFLRGEASGGKDATNEYKKVKSDANLYGYFQKLNKLLSR